MALAVRARIWAPEAGERMGEAVQAGQAVSQQAAPEVLRSQRAIKRELREERAACKIRVAPARVLRVPAEAVMLMETLLPMLAVPVGQERNGMALTAAVVVAAVGEALLAAVE